MSNDRVQDILTAVFAAGAQDGANLPESLCDMCVRDLPVDGAGLSLMNDHSTPLRVTATDVRARRLEELQMTLGEGPCTEAFATRRPVFLPNFGATEDGRWPAFAAAAADSGVGAVFAFPVQLGAIRLGALDLYRARPGGLDDAATVEAWAFADAALLVLLHLQSDMPAGQLAHELDAAWMSRAEVHQATGMISVQAQVDLPDALALLRARAFATSQPAVDVAVDVVSRRFRFDTYEAGIT